MNTKLSKKEVDDIRDWTINSLDDNMREFMYIIDHSFQCPECGSWNTWQVAKGDGCNDCGYYQGYP